MSKCKMNCCSCCCCNKNIVKRKPKRRVVTKSKLPKQIIRMNAMPQPLTQQPVIWGKFEMPKNINDPSTLLGEITGITPRKQRTDKQKEETARKRRRRDEAVKLGERFRDVVEAEAEAEPFEK
jgi:hypothetical protein